MLGAAVEGLGLAQVPEPIAAGAVKAGKLVRVLGPFAPMAPGVFLCYPGHRQIMPKLRAFIDHVKSRSSVANKTHISPGDAPPKRSQLEPFLALLMSPSGHQEPRRDVRNHGSFSRKRHASAWFGLTNGPRPLPLLAVRPLDDWNDIPR
jgi:hypothetical protein